MKLFKYSIFLPLILIASCDGISLSSNPSISSSEPELSYVTSHDSIPSISSTELVGDQVTIDFYNLNDFHGAVEHNPSSGELGIALLGGYFEDRLAANPQSVFISSGDMWQGSADSNITKGRLVVDAMNDIGFSGMAIGNHEFDWTDQAIIANVANMNFPLLGINVIDKRTNQRASFVEPYTMINRGGVNIGLIGTIGANLESSILASAVANYSFIPYTNLVRDASQFLRAQGAKIVLLMNHDGSVEQGVLPYVDGVFNGHTHRIEKNMIQNTPVYQASAYGRAIAHMQFTYDAVNDTVTFNQFNSGVYTYSNLYDMGQFPTPSLSVEAIYQRYLDEEINVIKNEVLGTAIGTFTTTVLGRLAVEEMLNFARGIDTQVVASFHNTGGVRSSIAAGEVTYGQLYRAFPFDNEIVIVSLTGAQLTWWLSQSGLHIKTIPNLGTIQSTQIYKIVSINFLTEKHWESNFQYMHDIASTNNTFEYIRELLKQRWQTQGTIQAADYN
jgi:2',3'-cyclic-nucleotide 2'-phosphodiesterase (5'-nucleotidase family)